MKTLICLSKTLKLALYAMLFILVPLMLTAQTAENKDVLPRDGVHHPGQVKDSTASLDHFAPVVSDMESNKSKESEKKDTSVKGKKDSFTPSQDEWLKNAGYFKSNKAAASKKSKREPEPRQSAEVVKERND